MAFIVGVVAVEVRKGKRWTIVTEANDEYDLWQKVSLVLEFFCEPRNQMLFHLVLVNSLDSIE